MSGTSRHRTQRQWQRTSTSVLRLSYTLTTQELDARVSGTIKLIRPTLTPLRFLSSVTVTIILCFVLPVELRSSWNKFKKDWELIALSCTCPTLSSESPGYCPYPSQGLEETLHTTFQMEIQYCWLRIRYSEWVLLVFSAILIPRSSGVGVAYLCLGNLGT